MINYSGNINGTFSFTASNSAGSATIGFNSVQNVSASFTFAGNSVSGSATSNDTTTVTFSAPGIPTQTTTNTSTFTESLSGSLPTISYSDSSEFGSTNYTWIFSPDKLQVSVSGSGTYTANSGISVGNGFFNSSGVLYADESSNPKIGDWLQSQWSTVLTTIQAVDPQVFSQAVAEFSTGGSVSNFISTLGSQINVGLAASIGRVGSVITQFGIGALDPDVAKGVEALVRVQNGGLSINVNQDKALRELFEQTETQFKAPIQPRSTDGNKSNFNNDVTGSSLEIFDPEIGHGYIYEAGSNGLKFESVVLPHLIGKVSDYKIFIKQGGDWVFSTKAGAINEIKFATPVDTFLVVGVDPSGLPVETPWISGLSFDKTGTFNGSITTLNLTDIEALKLPSIWNKQPENIEIAASTYQFFTGKIPGEGGFEFLIDSSVNTNDLNDPFYTQFNTENRFINFANNLGSFGEGASAFQTKFGALSFDDTIKLAFEEIIGTPAIIADGGNPDNSLDFFIGAKSYYAAVANERVVPSGVDFDQALKVVAIGSILNEAMKANLGRYSDAIDTVINEISTTGNTNSFEQDLFG